MVDLVFWGILFFFYYCLLSVSLLVTYFHKLLDPTAISPEKTTKITR